MPWEALESSTGDLWDGSLASGLVFKPFGAGLCSKDSKLPVIGFEVTRLQEMVTSPEKRAR